MFCVTSLHIIGPGLSVMLPEVVGHVSLYLQRAMTPEKKHNKRPLQCARCLTTLKRADSILTYAHIPSPHCVKGANSQRCGRGYIKEIVISRQHSAARNSNGGNPEDAPQQYCDVTIIRQTSHFRFWRRQISRWRRS